MTDGTSKAKKTKRDLAEVIPYAMAYLPIPDSWKVLSKPDVAKTERRNKDKQAE